MKSFTRVLFVFFSSKYFYKEKPPWKEILTSVPMWGITIGHFGACWGYYTLFTQMPTYLKDIQHLDIKTVTRFVVNIYVCTHFAITLQHFIQSTASEHLFSLVVVTWLNAKVTRQKSLAALRRSRNVLQSTAKPTQRSCL